MPELKRKKQRKGIVDQVIAAADLLFFYNHIVIEKNCSLNVRYFLTIYDCKRFIAC